tara:strand:- start:144 stop:458 length:315 start_codon:yes stop_codon:yes gene_type:complete
MDRVGQDHWLLQDVVHTEVLDQLQHSRSSVLDSQSSDNNSRTHIWITDMATVFLQPVDQCDVDMGQLQKTSTDTGWIQHSLDMAQHDGPGTASDTRIAVMHNEH